MLIYQGNTVEFFEDVTYNRIADIMQENYEEFIGRSASPNEFRSWQNSLFSNN